MTIICQWLFPQKTCNLCFFKEFRHPAVLVSMFLRKTEKNSRREFSLTAALSRTSAGNVIHSMNRRTTRPGLWPHTCLYPVSGGLTSKIRHDHSRFLLTAYVDPFARIWPGLSTTNMTRHIPGHSITSPFATQYGFTFLSKHFPSPL